MGDLQAVLYNCALLWGNTKEEKRKKKKKIKYSLARGPWEISSRISTLERPKILKQSCSTLAQGYTHIHST